jgi:hypothetical protein
MNRTPVRRLLPERRHTGYVFRRSPKHVEKAQRLNSAGAAETSPAFESTAPQAPNYVGSNES